MTTSGMHPENHTWRGKLKVKRVKLRIVQSLAESPHRERP
uniref:Uncharacterized protein n=1 Tax=Ralstonia solanacearum TaxID=305 RepID=A0A0S4X3K2_RALSL|nr:protein of unknown function [Ralstonia solanacearum]